ncbi:MAG: hypothetical protein Q9168_005694 [Polycauliona sp. 1 TL-2023]
MLFKNLSLTTVLFSIIVSASPVVHIRAQVDVSSPPTRDATCPSGQTISANDLIASVQHANTWVQDSPHKTYPRPFHLSNGIAFPNCEGMDLWEYPMLVGQSNPWMPGKNGKIPGTNKVIRVVFAQIDATTAIFCGVVEKDENKQFQQADVDSCPV